MCVPNIIMFHRVKIHEQPSFNKYYFKRKMVHDLDEVYLIIDNLIIDGLVPGSIEQCINDNKYFHLSFDDGFKEHLEVAKQIKEKYNFPYESVSFSINVGNSLKQEFTGMDIIYQSISNDLFSKVCNVLDRDFNVGDIPAIKVHVSKLQPHQLRSISIQVPELHDLLINTFMNEQEINELSELYKIVSHGMSHRFLTINKVESEKEILESKNILEALTGKTIDVFCYPEGKNDLIIQQYCKEAGYKYGLSIRHENNNKYCIGRKIK